MYRKTFCEKFNLSFFKPKKDQCSTCALYDRKRAAGTLDETLEREYALHQEEKEIARQEKTGDKERARTDKSVCDLSTVSCHSACGIDSAVMPAPTYRQALSSLNRIQRRFTNS